jgi:hypothetical protein
MYKFLDIFFLVFHTVLTLFNLFGWIWKRTLRANLVTLVFTFFAWFGLGIFYGIGYCPLTDWHFRVLRKMGETNLPDSYITYLINRLTGAMPSESLVEVLTVVLFFGALIMSVYLNFRRKN